MKDELEQFKAIANEMQPHFDKWVEAYGALAVVKVLAVFINQVAEEQPDPDAAIKGYIRLLRFTREAFKMEKQE